MPRIEHTPVMRFSPSTYRKKCLLLTSLIFIHVISADVVAADAAGLNEDCGVMILSSKAALMYTNIKLPNPHWNNVSLEEALTLLNRVLLDTTLRSPSEVAKASSRNVDEKKVRVTVKEEGDVSLIEVLAIIAETCSLKIVASDREIVFRPAGDRK